MSLVNIIGFSVIIIYILLQIFTFYGIGRDVYGVYLAFFVFLLLCMLVLPKNIPDI
jgi:hypothetical protein